MREFVMAKTASPTDERIEAFAEDLGRVLGTARAKADSWLGQRQAIVKQLTQLRDEASALLNQLGHQAAAACYPLAGSERPSAVLARASETFDE